MRQVAHTTLTFHVLKSFIKVASSSVKSRYLLGPENGSILGVEICCRDTVPGTGRRARLAILNPGWLGLLFFAFSAKISTG